MQAHFCAGGYLCRDAGPLADQQRHPWTRRWRIPVEFAKRSFEQAVNSPKRELKIFEPSDYEVEHCGAHNGRIDRAYSADWVAETFDCLPKKG